MAYAFLFLLGISVLLTPVCILFTWVENVSHLTKEEIENNWRQAVLFAAQITVTVAVCPLWYYIFNHNDSAIGAQDRFQHRLFRGSLGLALIALGGSSVGKGFAKKTTVVSSVLVVANRVAMGALS